MNSILLDNDDEPTPKSEGSNSPILSIVPEPESIVEPPAEKKVEDIPPVLTSSSEQDSLAENIRRSGLAYSAAIAFVASVVFMLVIGWGADLLLGTSPWGIVVGIVLGSVIGFVQFFRINSQIFKKPSETGSGRILDTDPKDEKPVE